MSRKQAERAFLRIRTAAGICGPDSVKHGPRLHDFRYTFAVVRLLTWYREGKDVQRLLPRLSTYLGHYTLQSTQRYLTMTPEAPGRPCSRSAPSSAESQPQSVDGNMTNPVMKTRSAPFSDCITLAPSAALHVHSDR